jgi:four helix bundle protein
MFPRFDHERLRAYQSSLRFIGWSEPILERIPKTAAIYAQLDRARISILLNIAEGNAKFSPAEKCRYFDSAQGSAMECAGCLDVLFLKRALTEQELEQGKDLLGEVVALLIGLIRSKRPERFAARKSRDQL